MNLTKNKLFLSLKLTILLVLIVESMAVNSNSIFCRKVLASVIGKHSSCNGCARFSSYTKPLFLSVMTSGNSLKNLGEKKNVLQMRFNTFSTASNNGGNSKLVLFEKSLNKVSLIGRVGADPEIRMLSATDRTASINVATSENWRDKASGEMKSKTEWHRVVVYDQTIVDLFEKFVRKGRKLYLEGSLQTRRWVANDGQERFTTEVVIPKFKGDVILLEEGSGSHNSDSGAGFSAGGSSGSRSGSGNQGVFGRVTSAMNNYHGKNGYSG